MDHFEELKLAVREHVSDVQCADLLAENFERDFLRLRSKGVSEHEALKSVKDLIKERIALN